MRRHRPVPAPFRDGFPDRALERAGPGCRWGGMRVFRGFVAFLALASAASAATIEAGPSDYRSKLSLLQPGDTLLLSPGDYVDLLSISGLHGNAGAWITIKGPDSGPKPRFLGDPSICCNTIEIRSASYLALENLEIDGQGIDGIFAISAAGSNTHNIRIEGCVIRGHSAHQQTVGISTKVPTWGWIVRRNTIVDAGTGMYFGNSTGNLAFVGGLIEYNVVLDSKGYNMQIKHQNQRELVTGMPTGPQRTIIRHNVFIKGNLPNEDGARPNVLVDGFPNSGAGSEDWYEIYGNVFFHNHRESLLQASGRVIIHDTIFLDGKVSGVGDAIYLTDHNKPLKRALVYNNTFYDCDRAITFASGADDEHAVVGNLMLVGVRGLGGNVSNASGNISDTTANANLYVKTPSLTWDVMDFYPLPGQAEGPALDYAAFAGHTDVDVDFNGTAKGGRTFRGAYAGSGVNPGWQLTQGIKNQSGGSPPPPPPPPDTTPPTASVRIDGGASSTDLLTVTLGLTASDAGAGMGAGAQMRFSNDGTTWSAPEPFATSRPGWRLDLFGGDAIAGTKTVHALVCDAAGNWIATPAASQIQYTPGSGPPPATGGGGSLDPLALLLLASALLLRRR